METTSDLDFKPLALCPSCGQIWTLPKEWEMRVKVAIHCQAKGRQFQHVCLKCAKLKEIHINPIAPPKKWANVVKNSRPWGKIEKD